MSASVGYPQISHPTDRPNFTVVSFGGITFWFSYRTIIAFQTPDDGIVVSENNWSVTTGKHLNYIEDDKKRRVPYSEFADRLDRVLDLMGKGLRSMDRAPREPVPTEQGVQGEAA
jgi:hypothetical protein